MNLDNLTNLSRSDIMRSLGLAPRWTDYLLPAVGIFAAGAVIGAGTALLLAPKSGAKLRKQIRDEFRARIDDLEERLNIGEHGDESKRSMGGSKSSQAGQKSEDKGKQAA